MYQVIDTETGQVVRTYASTRLPAALLFSINLNLSLRVKSWRYAGLPDRYEVIATGASAPKAKGL